MTKGKKNSSDEDGGFGASHRCNFCGKPASKVKRLFAGYEAFICNECVALCHDIMDTTPDESEAEEIFDLPRPTERNKFLNQYVIGQEEAKKNVSVAVYNHYKRINTGVRAKQGKKKGPVVRPSRFFWRRLMKKFF